MKLMKRKILIIFMVYLMLSLSFSIPVLAATNSYSKSITLNTTGKTSFSCGIIRDDSQITQVKLSMSISNGSSAPSYTIYLESPSGTVVALPPLIRAGEYRINSFNGEPPKGTWYAWIERIDKTNNLITSVRVGINVEYN